MILASYHTSTAVFFLIKCSAFFTETPAHVLRTHSALCYQQMKDSLKESQAMRLTFQNELGCARKDAERRLAEHNRHAKKEKVPCSSYHIIYVEIATKKEPAHRRVASRSLSLTDLIAQPTWYGPLQFDVGLPPRCVTL